MEPRRCPTWLVALRVATKQSNAPISHAPRSPDCERSALAVVFGSLSVITAELGHRVSLKESMLFDDQPTGGGVLRSTVQRSSVIHPEKGNCTGWQTGFISNSYLIVVSLK